MAFLFLGGCGPRLIGRRPRGNPLLAGTDQHAGRIALPAENMEGKEVRFGIAKLNPLRHGNNRRQFVGP